MALFVLDTEIVTTGSGSTKSISSQLNDIAGAVAGYDVDTDTEESFNFTGARDVIAQNIEACATKVSNSSGYMEAVVTSHTALQQNEFMSPAEKARMKSQESGGDTVGSYGGGGYGGGGSYGGGSYGGGGSYNADNFVIADGLVTDPTKDRESVLLSTAACAYLATDQVTLPTIQLLNESKATSEGYLKIGSRYLIACDKSIANVGDVLSFVKEDGSVVEFVVATTTTSKDSKNTITFIMDPNNKTPVAIDDYKTLYNNVKEVKNRGNIAEVSKTGPLVSGTETSSDKSTVEKASDENTSQEGTTPKGEERLAGGTIGTSSDASAQKENTTDNDNGEKTSTDGETAGTANTEKSTVASMTDTIKESLNQKASGTTGEVVGNTPNETASDNSNASGTERSAGGGMIDTKNPTMYSGTPDEKSIEKLDEGGTIV